MVGEDDGHVQHVLAVERHPGRPVRLLERAAGGERGAAVEDADVVEAQEPAGEDVLSLRVLPVHPPVEVEHQALERALQELDVFPAQVLLHLVEEERGPRVDRGVHVAEVPLVRRHLAVGMAVEAAEHQEELLLGEVEVHERQRDRVERQVPGRVPGVLPLVGHGDDVAVQHVEPLGVADTTARSAEERVSLVLLQPPVEVEVVVLLRPEHPREGLSVHPALVLAERSGRDPLVELVGVEEPLPERLLERCPELLARGPPGQAELDERDAARRHLEDVKHRGLRPGLPGVHGVTLPGDHVSVEGVLHVRSRVRLAPEPLGVRLVLREQELRLAAARERVLAQLGMGGQDRPALRAENRLLSLVSPRPGVPEPQRRDEVQPGRLLPAVVDRHLDQDVLRPLLGVLQEDIEVPVVRESPRVEELVLELLLRASPVRLDEVPVGELALGVLVEVLHVRVGRRRVDVEVVLLDVLAVVPLAVGEAERALLEDRIPPVPEGEGEAEALLVVGEAAEAVLAPPVGPGAGLVVGEVVPGVAVLAVVLADRPPLPLAEVGAPLLPGNARLPGLVQPLLLGGVHDPRVGCLIPCHERSLSRSPSLPAATRLVRLAPDYHLPDPCRPATARGRPPAPGGGAAPAAPAGDRRRSRTARSRRCTPSAAHPRSPARGGGGRRHP